MAELCSGARLMWAFAGEGAGRATGSRRRRARARAHDGSEVGAACTAVFALLTFVAVFLFLYF